MRRAPSSSRDPGNRDRLLTFTPDGNRRDHLVPRDARRTTGGANTEMPDDVLVGIDHRSRPHDPSPLVQGAAVEVALGIWHSSGEDEVGKQLMLRKFVHPRGAGVDLAREALGSFGFEAPSRGPQRVGLIDEHRKAVVGRCRHERAATDDHRLEIELAARHPDVDTGAARRVGDERHGNGKGAPLRGVRRERVGVLQCAANPRRDLALDVLLRDDDLAPPFELDDEMILGDSSHDAERSVAHPGATRSPGGSEVVVANASDHLVAALEAKPRGRELRAGQRAVGLEEDTSSRVQRDPLKVVFRGHRARSASGVGTAALTLRVPGAGEEVDGLLGALGFGDPPVAFETFERLGDLALAVLGVREADFGHLGTLLTVDVGKRRHLVGMGLDEVTEDATGRDRAVLGGIADNPERRSAFRDRLGQEREVLGREQRRLVDQ
jgi:hypothetical protein